MHNSFLHMWLEFANRFHFHFLYLHGFKVFHVIIFKIVGFSKAFLPHAVRRIQFHPFHEGKNARAWTNTELIADFFVEKYGSRPGIEPFCQCIQPVIILNSLHNFELLKTLQPLVTLTSLKLHFLETVNGWCSRAKTQRKLAVRGQKHVRLQYHVTRFVRET